MSLINHWPIFTVHLCCRPLTFWVSSKPLNRFRFLACLTCFYQCYHVTTSQQLTWLAQCCYYFYEWGPKLYIKQETKLIKRNNVISSPYNVVMFNGSVSSWHIYTSSRYRVRLCFGLHQFLFGAGQVVNNGFIRVLLLKTLACIWGQS